MRLVLVLTILLSALPAMATDGVLEINQTAVTAGGITPGDTPGFPATLSQPGSYRLTGDLKVPNTNTDAIVLTASDATLDLNGFSIVGPNVCVESDRSVTCSDLGTGRGIEALTAGQFDVTVRNGTIRGMGEHGILLRSLSGRVEDVQVISNGDDGINVQGLFIVARSIVTLNRRSGIEADDPGSIVIGNTVTRNGAHGIEIQTGALVKDNVCVRNAGVGIDTGFGVTISGNSAVDNAQLGLRIAGSAGYEGNVIQSNIGGTVFGGIEIGTNLCDGTTTCP